MRNFMPLPRRELPVPRAPDRTAPGGPSPDVLAAARGLGEACGDATLLEDGLERPGCARLVVTGGPGKGAEFALSGDVATVGRAARNDVCVPDLSVSRRHCRLEREGDRWAVLDQSSGNGTSVNGKPVSRRRLRHGDEIALGDTTLRFVEPFGVLVWPAAEPEGSGAVDRRRLLRPLALSSAALLLASAAVAGAVLVRRQRSLAIAEERARTEAVRAHARSWFRQGAELVKQGLWVDARDKLRIAAELDARDPEIARQLRLADEEVGRAQTRAEQERADEEARAREVEAVHAGRVAGKPDQVASARKASDGSAPREVAGVLEAYLGGDVPTALYRARTARSTAASRLAEPLALFAAAYQEGLTGGDHAAALRALDVAAGADQAMTQGREGRIARDIGKALAVRHLLLAEELVAEEELPRAAAHLREAARTDPADAAVQEDLRRLADRAREIYLRAYLARDADPEGARKRFMLVRDALPPQDEDAQNAARWVERLEGKGAP